MSKHSLTAIALALAVAVPTFAAPATAAPSSKGKVLVVMSGAHELELKDGKTYKTGNYLDEVAIPVRAILAAGYTPVFASPGGVVPAIDVNSENATFYYGGDTNALKADQALWAKLDGLKHPKKLSDVAAAGTSEYVGVFVPGGFAPLQDLVTNKDLGKILLSFHANSRPTAMICHGPIALISTLSDPAAFETAMVEGNLSKAHELAAGWPYAGYRLTVFSSSEELLAPPQLGGHPKFFVSDALSQAGAHVDRLQQGAVNVIEDRELITGQQPFSSQALGTAFVAKLDAAGSNGRGAGD